MSKQKKKYIRKVAAGFWLSTTQLFSLEQSIKNAETLTAELEKRGYFDPEPKPEPEPTQKEIRTFADLNDHIKNKKPRDLDKEYPMTVRPQEGAKVIINKIVLEYFGGALYQNGHGRNDEYIHKWEDIGVDLTWRYAQ